MASDNEASCVSDPNFAVICSFLNCFGKSCGIEYPDIAMLQEMVENSQEVPQQLIDLHIKLLRKTRKTVTAEKWERALVKFCHTYSNQDGWELERFGYKKARIAVKLRLLKVLLEAQFDMNQRFKNEVNKLAANELRVEPLGRDKSGLAYWCQLDDECNIRVYREDLDEESWQLVAKDRDEVVNLISTLTNGEAGDIPVNEDSNSLEISEKPIIDTGQVTSSPSLEEGVANGVEADDGEDESDEDEEEGDEEDDEEGEEEEEEGEEEDVDEESSQDDDEESQDSVKPDTVLKKIEPKIRNPETSVISVTIEPRAKAETELKNSETTVIKTSPIKVINIAELTKPQEERKLDVKVPIGITLTPVTKSVDVPEVLKTRENPKTSGVYYPNEPKLGQNKISLKPIDKLAANLVKLQSEKHEKTSGNKSLEKIAENLARSGLHGIVTSPEEDRQIPDYFPRNQPDKSNSSRSQRGMDLSTSPRGWESHRPVDFSGIDLSSRKTTVKSNELASPGYRAQDFQHKEIDLSTKKPARPEISNLPFDARTLPRSHGVITDLSKRQCLPQKLYQGYDIPQAYRADHRLPNYTMLPDPSKIAASRLGPSAKRPLEDDDLPHDIAKRIHADVIPIRGTTEPRQQILGSNWRDEVGEAIEEPVMMVQGEGSGRDCEGVNPGIGEAVDEPVLYFYGEGFGLECETGNPADETPNPDSKESKKDETEREDFEIASEPGTSVNPEALEAGTESDKTKFKPTLGIQVFNKTSGSPVKRLSRWDVRRPTEKMNADHESNEPESPVKEHFKFQEETLSTIKESTAESYEEASDSQTEICDKKRSDVSEIEKGQLSSPTIEEPCRHDSSTSIGAGLIKALIPGLLAVPEAENLADKQKIGETDDLTPIISSSSKDLPEENEANDTSDESMPRFFFGPNCVSFNAKKDETKEQPQTETDVKQEDNENIVKLADDLAKSVSIDTTKESTDSMTDDIEKEESTDLLVPETVSKEKIPEEEIDADCTPVDERFEKLAVSEAGTAGTSKPVDSVSEIDDSKNETIEVNKSFEKLAVSEAEPTENLEETSCLQSNKEDEEQEKELVISESENTGENIEDKSTDLPTDTQSIEETSDSVDKAAEIEKESIDSVPQVKEDSDNDESVEEPDPFVADSQIHKEDVEEEIDSQTVEEKKEVEDPLPAAQSISTESESPIKDSIKDKQEAELSDHEESEDNLKPEIDTKTGEDVSEVKPQEAEGEDEKSSGQPNDSQLSEEFLESQAISDLGTINEDELLKSSSDSELDQNIKNEKSNGEEEPRQSSQSEAAGNIDKNEDSENVAEVESEVASKVDENPTIEESPEVDQELESESIEEREDTVEKSVQSLEKDNEVFDSLSEASLDDDRSQDESKDAKEDTVTENLEVEAENHDSEIVEKAVSPGLVNNEEKSEKSSGLEKEEDVPPNKEDLCVNQITPAAITDSNVSKSPERINVDGKNEGGETRLADITDYCDPASENPSSSADQDSNEAMVIDDRVYDSNESSKDVGNEDSSLNEEKKLDTIPTVEAAEKTSEKIEKSCFNLGIVSGGSEQEADEPLPDKIPNEVEAKAEAEQNSISELVDKSVVERFREESEVEDILENLTQDASTDDQKSLVANYDSSDRESDDVFENDLLDSASNADDFNDSKSNELIPTKDEEEDLLGKVENEVKDDEKLSNEDIDKARVSKNDNTDEVIEAKTPVVEMNLEKEEEKPDDEKENVETSADSKSEEVIPEAENVEEPKESFENTKEALNVEVTAPETEIQSSIDNQEDSNEGEMVTELSKSAETEIPEVKIVEDPGSDSTNKKIVEDVAEMNAKESEKSEAIETLSNSTISASVKVDKDLCKSTENRICDGKKDEESIENKFEVANASIPLTIAAKHSLEPDKDETEEGDEIGEPFDEEEPPVVHLSKRFKEDYNASILADDSKEMKAVSLVEKDLIKNDGTEITPASEPLNHDDYKPTEIETPKEAESLLPLDAIEDKSVAVPVVIEANKKTEEEAPMSEDILTLKSKPVNFEIANSGSKVMTAQLEELKKPEIDIQENCSKGEKIQMMENQIMKLSNEDQTSEIHRVNLGVVTIESDDSMGADNDDCFSVPQDEVDPLACVDEDPLARPIEANSAAALGIRVKPVSELVYEGWKLDGTETPKISRKRRNSNHESNSEDVVMKDDEDESEGTGGKRMRLRGKRPPDMNLRRTVEEKRQEAASSDDEASKKPTDMVKEDSKDCDDVTIIDTVGIDKKRGRPRGKRKVRRTIRLPGQPAATPAADQSQPDSSVTKPQTEVLSSPVISGDTPQKKRKKRKMVLGLEIGRDIVDTSEGGVDLNETPVRQSRRIAQLKIKEEADRRRIEEETLCEMKEKKDRDYVGGGSGDKRKRKKQRAESEDEVSSKEIETESKAKKKRKKKKRKKKPSAKFDEQNPWRSSSGSSTEDEDDQDEEDDEDEEAESEGSVLFKSDHEFSPESDLEKDEESEPLRRARTAQKAQSDVEEADDEYACQKCGKADHPEWILLCDTCDKGWHCSCLRPALMLIPEGDWFCPPCQHNLLVLKLQENLKKFDQSTKKHENELLRKKRLAFVGISLDNVLHQKESHQRSSRASSQDSDNDSSSSASSSSQSGSSSSEESEPVYQLRERRCANTYKFNEYDDMINAAIQDEVEAVRGAGNQGRGKDIATIVNAEKEEAEAEALKINRAEVEEEDDDKVEKESDEDYKAEKDEDVDDDDDDEDDKPKIAAKKIFSRKKHRKLNSLDISSEDDPESDEDFKGSSSDDDDDPEDQASSSDDSCFDSRRRGRRGGAPVRRSTRARMTRYDEDFINDDSEDSDRPKRKKSRSVWDESESEESDNSWRQRKKRSKTVPTPKSRSSNKSKSNKKSGRKKKQVIESDNQSENEDEEEEEVATSVDKNEPEETPVVQTVPARDLEQPVLENEEEKIIPVQNEAGNETEQTTEEVKEESKDNIVVAPLLPLIEDEKIAAKKKETTPKRKKTPPIRRKIVYGGLQDSYEQQEEETVGRRTRGKKINYQEVLASDSEEELKKALKKTEESEDEFVVNEVEDLNEEAEKDSDSGDIYSPKKEGPKGPKGKSPKGKKPRKSKSPAASLKLGTSDNDTPKARKKPGPKPGSKNKPRSTKMTPPFGNPRSGGEEGDVTEEGSLAGLGAEDLAELDEEQLDQMMMEDEEYGKRQLELAAIEIARKKKEEREAKKLEKARLKALEILAAERQRDPNAPEGTDGEAPKKKKRGRRSKAEILAEQMRRDGAPNLSIESPSPNLSTAILSPGLNLSTTPLVSPGAAAPTLPPNMTSPNLSSFLNPNSGGLNLAPNLTTAMVPNLPHLPIPDAHKIHESLVPGADIHAFSPDNMLGVKPKRRGRGKGKKTLALEAARAAEAANRGVDHLSGFGTDSNPEIKSDDPSVLPTPGSSTSGSAPSTPPASIGTPVSTLSQPPVTTIQQAQSYPTMPPAQQQSSVITRMLQSQPVSGGPQSFAAAAAAMGHKYFGAPTTTGNMMGVPRPGFDLQPRGRIPSPYRQPGQSPMPPHFAAVRSGAPPMRMRVPGPQMYHTPHHPMDPSPSGGGPISITSNRDRSSPSGAGLGPAMIPPAAGSPLAKGGPTPPPPPPYARGVPPMGRFPDSSVMGGPRHQIPPFANASGPANHGLQQPSPPPNRASGNFSPYHPPPPPNYHYGAYPPPPPMTTADDAAAYQGSPYPNTEHFSTPPENPGPVQPPQPPPQPQTQSQAHNHPGETPQGGNKQFDEEGTGEFGGLVSYFSSQREDDLDS